VESDVSDVATMMRTAAINAAKAMSCKAVSRRWFMLTADRKKARNRGAAEPK
jgi:D-alanine-D-alanine ligase-like ATP-grasp enzyme